LKVAPVTPAGDVARFGPMDPAGIPALIDAIRHMHNADAVHRETVHVREVHSGKVVWEGDVEVFDMTGNTKSHIAYAWSEAATGSGRKCFAMLHGPIVTSPAKAVQGSIYADEMALERAKRSLRYDGFGIKHLELPNPGRCGAQRPKDWKGKWPRARGGSGCD
jgi:hypothetical protein